MALARSIYLSLLLALACGRSNRDQDSGSFSMAGGPRPDELPVMLNREPPFRYPPSLYEKKVQGNVTLRLYIDDDGHVRPESTLVAQASGYPLLDSAAAQGSRNLNFVPAKTNGTARDVMVLYPVFFRHPEAQPLAGDTILRSAKGSTDHTNASTARR